MSIARTSQPVHATPRARRALLAGCIGNLIEWYDFALYGAFATVLATTFFPEAAPGSGLVATFGIFAVAFFARPVGALLFGHFGDRLGRRRTLAVGILMMAVVTAAIGLLPSYERIGWLAPALLGLLRVAQGVSIGGEYGGSAAFVVEFAPSARRGWYGGWQWATLGFGLAAGIGMAAILSATLSDADLAAWGWRLPFLLALPLGVTGLYVRLALDETPAFLAMEGAGTRARAPVLEVLRVARREAAIGFGLVATATVTFNVYYVFLPNALAAQGRMSLSTTLGVAVAGLVLGSAAAPALGRWSDAIGRRPLLVGGTAALLVSMLPASALISSGTLPRMLAGYALISVALGALTMTTFLTEMFPTPIRYSGLSVTYGLASAVFGGTAPVVAAALTGAAGGVVPATLYALGIALVGVVCAVAAPETAGRPLDW